VSNLQSLPPTLFLKFHQNGPGYSGAPLGFPQFLFLVGLGWGVFGGLGLVASEEAETRHFDMSVHLDPHVSTRTLRVR